MSFHSLFVAVAVFLTSAAKPITAQDVSVNAEIAATIATIRAQYDQLRALEKAELGPIKAGYFQQIQQLRNAAQARGNLDSVLELEATLKAVEAGSPLPPVRVMAPQLQVLTTNYDRNAGLVAKKYEPYRLRLEADFQRTLADLEQGFTRRSKLDEAIQVRQLRLGGFNAALGLVGAKQSPESTPGIARAGEVSGGSTLLAMGSAAGVLVNILPTMKGPSEHKAGLTSFNKGEGIRTAKSFNSLLKYTPKTARSVDGR